jgi:hypothetical protein
MKNIVFGLIAFVMCLQCFANAANGQQKAKATIETDNVRIILQNLVDDYFNSLNETDARKRLEIVEKVWHKDGIFAYPETEVKGFSAISNDVLKVQKKYPKALVKRTSDIEVIENKYLRFTWEFGVQGEEPLIKGFDFVHVVDNKLKLVVGYFDYVSEKAK